MELPESGAKRTGGVLLAGRVAAGLELVDIARETRVPLRHLKALEADAHEDLPALPYAIGFVKAYARAIGLDSETVAAQFRTETTKSAHVPTQMTLEPLDERRLPSRGLMVGSFALLVTIIAGLSAWGSGAFDTPLPAPVTNLASAPQATPAAEAIADPALDASAAVPAGAAIGTAPAATGPVVLTAKEDVWVKIYARASKTSVKIGVLKAGESFAVPANPPGLLLWTGKAGAIDITVGGSAIPPLGGPVETVRNVSLAAADLTARPAAKLAVGAIPATGPKPIATIPGN